MKKIAIGLAAFCGMALLVSCGQSWGKQTLEGPPDLVVAWEEQEVIAWKGGYSWTKPAGDGTMEGTIACGPAPLEVIEDLPVVSAEAGDQVVLVFAGVPDKLQVYCYPAEDRATDAQSVEQPLMNGNVLVPPEGDTGKVYEAHAKWESGGNDGSALYAFYIP